MVRKNKGKSVELDLKKKGSVKMDDMPGGGLHLGETSEKRIEREVFEEKGIKAQADRLAVVCENFFKGIGGTIDGLQY